MNTEAKEWHKKVKKLTNYTKKSNILDLEKGPISIRQQWLEARDGNKEWEEVETTTN